MEDHYEYSKFEVQWEEYETMFSAETKSQIVNRMGEIIMIQSLLEEILKKKKPLIMDTFWKNLVSEKQWIGKWENFRDHYRKTVSKRIEKLHFIDSKYRALLMYATSASVTEQFQQELADDCCHCLYDEHSRIIAIRSNDCEIDIKGKHRKMAVTRNRKTKKVDEKKDDDDDEDDEKKDDDDDEKEEAEVDEIEEVRMNADDEKDEVFEMEDEVKLESKEALTIGTLYTKLKQVLEIHFKSQQIGISLDLELEEEVDKKELSSEESQKLLEKIAKTIANSPNEMLDGIKIEKLQIMKTLDSIAFGMARYDNAEINRMMKLECDRKEVSKREQKQDFDNFLLQSISLSVLAPLMIELLDE
ncbi:hypothetical protein CRE_21003 [Caenorhabditis remanei]|uniref:SPK domain-containing protein n=1 Tax=Caenorhabditis remanei TaxID=31234 RepID=E3NKG6_CAERE|nr:hypothetical protein CRE_21003 [Caenorhabditis remanei]